MPTTKSLNFSNICPLLPLSPSTEKHHSRPCNLQGNGYLIGSKVGMTQTFVNKNEKQNFKKYTVNTIDREVRKKLFHCSAPKEKWFEASFS